MTSVTIYHNPQCSKSRQTLALLEERDLDIRKVHYLESPPSMKELEAIVKMLGVQAIDIIRSGEDEYRDAGLTTDSTDADILSAIIAAPKLLQRPIVISNGRARVGRPPESVLEIL